MKAPTQCALWTSPQRSYDPDFFEILEVFGSEEHWSRDLRKCRECGQLYVHDFYEEMNFSGGEDYQSMMYIPVETKEDAETLKGLMVYELHGFFPRLEKDSGRARWLQDRA